MLEALVKRAPLAPVGEAEAACERRRGPLGGAALAENAGQVLAERDRERDGRGGVWGVTEQKTTLTSILGQIVVLRFRGRSSWREAEAQLAAVEPGDRGGLVGEAGVDQDGVVGA